MSVSKHTGICLLLAGALLTVQANAQFLPNRAVTPSTQPTKAALPSWYVVDKAVTQDLLTADLGTLARKAVRAPFPRTEQDRMRALSLFLRAGYRKEALRLIRRLPVMRDAEVSTAWQGALETLYAHHDWELVGALLDRMPRATPGWTQYFLNYRLKTESPESIDRWILSRAAFAPAYWLDWRIFLWSRSGQAARVLDPLAADVRRHPTDFARAENYVHAARQTSPVSLDWMAGVCKPTLAMESFQLGQEIALRSHSAAVALLLHSLATPFTRHDARWFSESHSPIALRSARPFGEISETQFRDWTKMALAENYQALGKADKAQPLLEEVSAHNPNGLPLGYGQFAGQTQAASGARVIEQRIRVAETKPENQNSPEYWTTRADYYAGRKENMQALEAYEKALDLTRKDPQSTDFARTIAMNNTAHFLFATQGAERAVQWDYRQLETADPSSEYARYIVHEILAHQDSTTHYIRPDDPRLWTYLGAQKVWLWGYSQSGQLLEEMAKTTPEAERAAFWKRVERLTLNADPSRAFAMGEALWQMHDWERMIPVLRAAYPRLPGETEQNFVRSYLFQAYIETNRWQEAEEMLNNAQRGLPLAYEISPQTLQQVAQAAARAGDLPAAFRVWKRAVNIDRRESGDLHALAQLGLRDQLRDYVRDLQAREPQCELPATFTAMLK